MQVFVTGATGALGRYVVPGPVVAGYEVTATTRTLGQVARLPEAGGPVPGYRLSQTSHDR